METRVNHIVFEYEGENLPEIEMDGSIDKEYRPLIEEMIWGGFLQDNALYIHKFLRPDLSINLEKLELAVSLAIKYLDSKTPFDDPIFLFIGGIEKYYELRGIQDKPKNKKEEYYFIRGFMQAIADNECYKMVAVEYL